MGFWIFFILIALCIFSYIYQKNIFAPAVVFNFVFALVAFASMFKVSTNGLALRTVKINFFTYFLILLGCFCFTIASICVKRTEKKGKNTKTNSTILYTYIGLTGFGLILNASKIFSYLKNGGKVQYIYRLSTNSAYVENELSSTAFGDKYNTFIGNPLYYLLTPYFLTVYFQDKTQKKYLIYSFIFLFLKIITHFSRVEIMYFMLYFIVLVIMNKREWRISKNKKKSSFKTIMVFAVITFFMFYVFTLRNTNYLKTFFDYFGKPLLYMQTLFNYADIHGHCFGYLSTLGIGQFIFGLLEQINITPPQLLNLAQQYANEIGAATVLPDGSIYNAFSTCFYYFYVDFGLFGVITISFIFGLISQKMFVRFKSRSDIQAMVCYLILLIWIGFSFIRWQLVRSEIALAFVYAFFLFKKQRALLRK